MSKPTELLLECKSCGIENVFNNYDPASFVVCNQCREPLIDHEMNETHNEFVCEDCGMRIILCKDTEFQVGESACRCGSQNIISLESTSISDEADSAGGLDREPGDEPLEDMDWLRSEAVNLEDEDYNDIFDRDLGTG